MPKSIEKKPLELPEYLSPEQMDRFRTDRNYRAERRRAKLEKLAPVAGQTALQGFTREWIFTEGETVSKPVPIDFLLIDKLAARIRYTKPLTDKITNRYDILPYEKSAWGYGGKNHRQFLARIKDEERDPQRIEILEQGAERSLEHTRDGLQFNLWLKMNIAKLRLAYADVATERVGRGETVEDELARYVGESIADIGYCLRTENGLLRSLDMEEGRLPYAIEHHGLYIADGHPEALLADSALLRLNWQQQDRRFDYWWQRYDATQKAFGNRLPDEELAMEDDLDTLIAALYAGPEAGY